MQIADAVLYNLSPSNGSSPPPSRTTKGTGTFMRIPGLMHAGTRVLDPKVLRRPLQFIPNLPRYAATCGDLTKRYEGFLPIEAISRWGVLYFIRIPWI